MLSVYLWQRAVELVNGMHHIQQHVVANHKFSLCVRSNGLGEQVIFTKPKILQTTSREWICCRQTACSSQQHYKHFVKTFSSCS